MGTVPKDPVMLLSYVNTQLRDFYASLGDMCASLGLEEKQIITALEQIDYSYDARSNRFL